MAKRHAKQVVYTRQVLYTKQLVTKVSERADNRVRAAAAAHKVSVAEVVRQCIDGWLGIQPPVGVVERGIEQEAEDEPIGRVERVA